MCASSQKNVVLGFSEVTLEPISVNYLYEFHSYSTDPRLYEYLEFSPFETLDQSLAYLNQLLYRASLQDANYWFIKRDDLIVGTIGYHSYDPRRLSAQIGYGVSPEHWGKGIFKQAGELLLSHLFNTLNVHRVSAITASRNLPSIRALEKMGFIYEGMMKDYYRYENGMWFDATVMSKLRPKSKK